MTEVRVEVSQPQDGVRLITLRNDATRNAIDGLMCEQLAAVAAQLRDDAEVRAAVITGADPAFCAGANLASLFGDLTRPIAAIRADLGTVYASFLALRELPFPTIAAVNGAAVGAGLNIALCCDVVIAGPKALFSVPFTKIGLHQGGGATHFLVEALGRQKAMRLLLEGGALNGADAVALGLAESAADDPLAAALELAAHVATLDGRLARDIKTSVRRAASSSLEAVVEFEAWAQAATAQGERFAEVVRSYRR